VLSAQCSLRERECELAKRPSREYGICKYKHIVIEVILSQIGVVVCKAKGKCIRNITVYSYSPSLNGIEGGVGVMVAWREGIL